MTEGQPPERFEIEIDVLPADIDVLGHVNNVVYLRWVQDAAVAHWRARASAADQAAIVWYVVRHEIDYRRPAVEGERIVAQTWVGEATRKGFERHTAILRKRDRKPLARALTLWRPIDAGTGRSAVVSDAIRSRFSVSGK